MTWELPLGEARPRLVATDLDGTLLDPAGHVTARTRAVLDELDRRGIPVVFVTGRPLRWMEPVWGAVGDHGLAICSNGAVLYDVGAKAIRAAHTIAVETALAVADTLRRVLPGTAFALEKTTGFGIEPAFWTAEAPPSSIPVGPVEDLSDHTVVKLLAQHPSLPPEAYWRRVDEAVGDRVTTTWSSSFALVEMSGWGVTKASTLAEVCAERGIAARDVVAFGDMPNDLPLLRWAGWSFAMANAHPSLRSVADHRAPSNAEDGVARVLTELFGLPD